MKIKDLFAIYYEHTHVVLKIFAIKFKIKKMYLHLFRPKIPFLVFWVGTKCTLKCKLCCNLIPYTAQRSYDADSILKDLDLLCKNSRIQMMQIQGGEPLSHPEIEKILDFINNLNIQTIELATNGTVKLSKSVLGAIKRNSRIMVRISNYKCADKLRENFINQLEEYNIPYTLYKFVYGNDTWFSTGGVNETKADDETTKITYDLCDDKGCVTLADGIITACGKIPSIKEIYNYNDKRKYDEIDIRKYSKKITPPPPQSCLPFLETLQLRNNIRQFYRHYNVFKQQCRFCRISKEKYPAAEQLSVEELNNVRRIK